MLSKKLDSGCYVRATAHRFLNFVFGNLAMPIE